MHARGVGFRRVADHEFGVIESEVGAVPVIEMIEVVNLWRGFRTGRIFAGLEVGLAQKRGVVTRFGKPMSDGGTVVLRQVGADMKATVFRRVLSGQKRAARRRADGIHCITAIERDAPCGEPIQVGRFDRGIQATNAIPALLVTGNEQDVQRFLISGHGGYVGIKAVGGSARRFAPRGRGWVGWPRTSLRE